MHARNTLIFLEKLKNIFPVIKSQAEIILKCLENIKSMDMEDLKQMCESYEKILKRKMESMIDVDVKKLRETVRPKNQTVSTNISTIRRTDIRIDNLNENNSKHKEKEDGFIIFSINLYIFI